MRQIRRQGGGVGDFKSLTCLHYPALTASHVDQHAVYKGTLDQ
jgi:hypothetical protein